jgi:Kef-type K+ transport system membrane component KefB
MQRDPTPSVLRAEGLGRTALTYVEVKDVALLIILALLVALFVGLGFVVKWLFILAVIAALVWVIAFFMGRARA